MEIKDKDLTERIREEMVNYEKRMDLEEDDEGYKKFKGLIFVPKSLEIETIQAHHDNLENGTLGFQE
jgi:hypothetical protein